MSRLVQYDPWIQSVGYQKSIQVGRICWKGIDFEPWSERVKEYMPRVHDKHYGFTIEWEDESRQDWQGWRNGWSWFQIRLITRWCVRRPIWMSDLWCQTKLWAACPSVYRSVTRYYWVKTNNRRIMRFSLASDNWVTRWDQISYHGQHTRDRSANLTAPRQWISFHQ